MTKPGSKLIKKIPLKPIIRIRVRCKEDHADPWLRRLYVLWAAPPDPQGPDPKANPKFFLAQSDQKGYLSPQKTKLDPNPETTVAMLPDHKYLCYFIRWPDSTLGKTVQEALQDYETAKSKWGEPKEIAPLLKSSGKAKHGAKIQEGVIEVDEDPNYFIQNGSDFYGGWTLFRDMPGTGSNNKDVDIQCEPLKKQVRRLQYHLGALRYPIGNQWHPYSPEPFTPTKSREKHVPELLYPNEGVFDVATWNSVLAFQRDARHGTAYKLLLSRPRTPTLDAGSFDPLPSAANWRLEITESAQYVSDVAADKTDAFADIPVDSDTVVDAPTGVAIRNWLTRNIRKPGKILVAYNQYDSWMQEKALGPIQALDKDLKRLGAHDSVQFNNALRDTRMSVLKAGKGQKINSIHKSGFAFDFSMDDFVGPRKDYPLYFVRDEDVKDKVCWIVYTPVAATSVPTSLLPGSLEKRSERDDYVKYEMSIRPWLYKPDHTDGGETGQEFQIKGALFLNFTKVCQHFGLDRISAHSDWVGSGETSTYELSDASEFLKFTAALAGATDFAVSPKYPKRQTALPNAKIDGAEYALTNLVDLSSYLSMWLAAANHISPTPDVEVTPGTKMADRFLALLRGKTFKGKKVRITAAGEWKGGEGASNVTTGANSSTGDLELGPKTEFPLKLDFVLRPLTSPVILAPGSKIEFPKFGTPQGMEWWHFQYTAGFHGEDWKTILGWIGWTEEGLLGKAGGKPIHGLYGLGYDSHRHLEKSAI